MNQDIRTTCKMIFQSVIPRNYIRPAEWSSHNIRFSHEKDPIKGPLDLTLTPYLVEPINAWELTPGQGLKEVTVVAPEQTGKSQSWMCGELWSCDHSPGLSLIYYTSDEKAEKVNEEKIEPMLRNIPKFEALLNLPGSKTADCYRLGDSLIYFGGVGARISSFSARRCVADEIDDWQDKKGTNSLNDLRKRARAFPEALLYKVCTPKGTDRQSRIWQEFLASSQGYWYLRCQSCGELSIRSCDIVRLQWEQDSDGEIIPDSLRLICPKCGREHVEAEKHRMNQQGGYIHRHPDRLLSHPGFQWGALASVFNAFSWVKIAAAQKAAGKSGDIDQQIYFDNSVRGRPYKVRKLDDTARAALKRHAAPPPEPSHILYRFLAVDTQDNGFFYVVRGMDAKQNTYLLGSGKAATTAELDRVWNTEYCGGTIICGIIDEGGHRADEVRTWAHRHTGMLTYKGNPRIGCNYKLSPEVKGLLLVNANHYRLHLLFAIYAAQNRGTFFWFLPEDLPADYAEQLSAWKPNPAVRNGNELENYVSDGNDHYFDCEKMLLALLDYFKACILPLLFNRKRVIVRK